MSLTTRIKESLVRLGIEPLANCLPHNVKVYLAANSFRHEIENLAIENLSLNRHLLSMLYLRGQGLEIGALNAPLPVPSTARVKYVDAVPFEELRETFSDVSYVQAPDIVMDGQTLPCIEDSTQDFVIANHFLEHCEDPIGTFKHFLRVLRVGGVLFLALPDKRFSFDVDRPATSFEHILKDHLEGPGWSRRSHFEEFFRIVLQTADVERIERAMQSENHVHFHVWSQTEMLTMVAAFKTHLGLDFEVEAYVKHGGEGIFVIRKGEAGKDRVEADISLNNIRKANKPMSASEKV